jgi:hypothetical protein
MRPGPWQENAVDFLLQPLSYTPLYVDRRAKHEEEVEVRQPPHGPRDKSGPSRYERWDVTQVSGGSTLLWRFTVGGGLDILFSAVFVPNASNGWVDWPLGPLPFFPFASRDHPVC